MLRNIPEQCKGNSQKKKNQKKEAMFLDGKTQHYKDVSSPWNKCKHN